MWPIEFTMAVSQGDFFTNKILWFRRSVLWFRRAASSCSQPGVAIVPWRLGPIFSTEPPSDRTVLNDATNSHHSPAISIMVVSYDRTVRPSYIQLYSIISSSIPSHASWLSLVIIDIAMPNYTQLCQL